MNTQKITESEIEDIKIASLPTRPTMPQAYGGIGYSSKDMKEAFDKLPLYVMERLNSLIGDIEAEGAGGVCESIKTNMFEGHSLKDFFNDFLLGTAAGYMGIYDTNLLEYLTKIREDVDKIAKELNVELN